MTVYINGVAQVGGDVIVPVTIVVAASNSVDPTRADYQCSGVADDVEINAALVAAAGGRVILLEGTFNCVANIVVPADTKLEGQGFGTILNFDDGGAGTVTNAGAITINGNDVHVFNLKAQLAAGCGSAGTRPNLVTANTRTLVWLENLWLVGDLSVADGGSDARQNGIYFTTVTESKIIACRSEDNKRNGIALDTSSDGNTISGNTCNQNNRQGIRLTNSSDNTLTGNICKGNTALGMMIFGASDNNIISGNLLEGSGQDGFYLGVSPDGNCITGNVCLGNAYNGITLVSADNNTISGNTCNGNGYDGINLNGSMRNNISGNTCNGNTRTGIVLAASDDNTISSNTCNYNLRYGIFLDICNNCVTTGNICIWNDGIGTTYSGIYLLASQENTVTGNKCDGSGAHGIGIFRSSYCTISGNVSSDNKDDGINITGDGTRNADHNNVTGNVCYSNNSHGIEVVGAGNANYNRVINNKLIDNVTAEFADAGIDTQLATYVVPFSQGSDPQDSGYLIDAGGEYARAYLRLPPEVQQVIRMVVYARAKTLETHEMELEMVIKGAADNEPYGTHDGSIVQLDSISVNFVADDVIFWRNTEAGILALLGGDSVEVKVLHEAAEGDNLDTQAYFRTVEIQYV